MALKFDQPHEITKKLWDMVRGKYHPNDVGIKLFEQQRSDSNEVLSKELESTKAQLSHCLGLLDMYKDQRDLLAKVSFKTIADRSIHMFCLNAS